MVMESSTREVWVSYQAVCHQDIPRFDTGVDGYPEDAQTTLSRYLVNKQRELSSVWSQSETLLCALGSLPSTKSLRLTA